jgi:hypothetical protein
LSNHQKNISNKDNKLFPIVTVIFLGSLGSGLWEFFLRDVSYFLLSWITSIADAMFSGFADSFYSDVGIAINPLLSFLVPIFFVMVVIAFPWIFTLIYYWQTSENMDDSEEVASNMIYEEYIPRRNKKLAVLYPAIAIIVTFLYGHILAADIHNLKSSNYLERSIEILRPHLIESKYYELRSEYRQVETRNQFKKLYIKLNKIGSKNEISLPDFSPLMIDNVPSK